MAEAALGAGEKVEKKRWRSMLMSVARGAGSLGADIAARLALGVLPLLPLRVKDVVVLQQVGLSSGDFRIRRGCRVLGTGGADIK